MFVKALTVVFWKIKTFFPKNMFFVRKNFISKKKITVWTTKLPFYEKKFYLLRYKMTNEYKLFKVFEFASALG